MSTPTDLIASVSGATVVAVIYLARGLSRLSQRVAYLEGRLNHKDEKD